MTPGLVDLLPLYCCQLVIYEFAVFGMWSFGGKVTDYLEYTNSETSSNQYFDTFASSLLSMYQVGLVVRDSPRARAVCQTDGIACFCVVS